MFVWGFWVLGRGIGLFWKGAVFFLWCGFRFGKVCVFGLVLGNVVC